MTLATVTSPVQWVVFAAVAVLLLAPRLIPPVARILGRLTRLLTAAGSHTAPVRPRRVSSRPALPESAGEVARNDRASSPLVGVIVVLAIAVLSWWLLRSR